MRRLLYLVILSSVLLAFAPAGAEGQLKRLRIAYVSVSGMQALAWIAKGAGLYERYGLEARLLYIRGGAITVQALVGGSLDLTFGGGSSAYRAIAKGKDLVFLGSHSNSLDHYLIASPEITRIDQLRGKKVSTQTFGGLTDLLTQDLLRKAGLDLKRDLTIIGGGTPTERIGAISRGLIQGTVVFMEETILAKRLGLTIITIPPVPYFRTGVLTTRTFIRQNEETIRAFVKAYVSSIHFFKTRKRESQQIMAQYMEIKDQEFLDHVYSNHPIHLLPRNPYPTPEGVQGFIDMERRADPTTKVLSMEELFDLRFLRGLDQSGFIDQLYSSK